MYREELTTKMHSGFNVSKETDVKLTAFMALDCMTELNYSYAQAAEIYPVTEAQIKEHELEYKNLLSV